MEFPTGNRQRHFFKRQTDRPTVIIALSKWIGCVIVLLTHLRITMQGGRYNERINISLLGPVEVLQVESAGSATVRLPRNALSELGTSLSREVYYERGDNWKQAS